MDEKLARWIRFARAHHARNMAISFIALSIVNAFFGSINLDMPFIGHVADSPIPFRKEVPLAFASVAVTGLHSAMGSLELAGSSSFRRAQVAWLAGSLMVAGIAVTAEGLVVGPEEALVSLRSMVIWSGIAIASGRCFGWRLSWVLPMLTIFPLTYWEVDDRGRHRWWDWPGQPISSLSCSVIAGISVLVAVCLIWLTPWRISMVKSKILMGALAGDSQVL